MNDVVVIGGGPSGLYTAGLLADSGIQVKVFEKKRSIGQDVLCTGIISKDAFQKFGLQKDSVLFELRHMELVSPFGTSLCYDHGDVFACVVDREKFDLNLARRASLNGAEIFTGTRVDDVEVSKQGVTVTTSSQQKGKTKHKARLAILSTGIEYRLHKKLGLGYPSHFINGAQVEFQNPKETAPRIMVGNKVAPGAFAWSIPVNDRRVRVGLITEKGAGAYLVKLVSQMHPEQGHESPELQYRGKVIAQGPVSPTFSDRVMSVGECAAQVKTTTGGGLYYGLFCSQIAVQTILQKMSSDSWTGSDLVDYEKEWKKAIKKELMIGYYARKVCSRLSDKELEKLFQLAKTNGVFPLIREKGHFDWQVDLIVELAKKAPVPALKALVRA
ncbi:MAG: geranylgeranyl reductase family protein [Candidatus Aminicenantes bacterium]|nr:geranylgeranyl reductase family protein [Candidatus Aminicenantes bacterium]